MRTGRSPGIVPNARFPLLPTWNEAEFAVPLPRDSRFPKENRHRST